ncbi:MAG: MotA/TolQ/ExbB proton channel family protein, partial [Akkermansia sp.]|nr:MotA/TolQ/ExbB proton channel family protein [Akkermansia sp.]
MKSTITRFGIRALSFGAVAMASMSTVFAAEEAKAPKTALDKWVIDGGWTMIPLVILLAITIFLVVYCCMSVSKSKFCPDDLRGQLVALMGECRVRSAIELATTSPTYLGRLVAYAMPNIDATRPEDLGKDSIEDAIADFTNNERPRVMFAIDILALVGSIAPSIGLFGTIQGMVGAFGTLAEAGQADPSALASDISVALLTTFWGLIISILAIPAFFFLKKHAQKLESESVNAISEMVNTSI